MTTFIKGTMLGSYQQKQVLAKYVHRFTRDHRPSWATKEWKDGKPYPVHFASDNDWLENTLFAITAKGELSRREKYCQSNPTWPDNPELRTKTI